MPRTETLEGGDVFVVTLDPEGTWDHSKFPHPLVTIDYDNDGRAIQVVAVGPEARRLSAALHTTLLDDLRDSAEPDAVRDVEQALAIA